MSFLIPCPHCGPRSVYEFRYGGEYKKRPRPDALESEWTRYNFLQANAAVYSQVVERIGATKSLEKQPLIGQVYRAAAIEITRCRRNARQLGQGVEILQVDPAIRGQVVEWVDAPKSLEKQLLIGQIHCSAAVEITRCRAGQFGQSE